ncbi:MAG TPA: amidohydrolase family protein [Acidimicrobiales bacterium]|nr:amidohydrolase family protein [Acidimicrobiales bacterium]
MHDLVIRNGHVVDGSGEPARPADVAITGDRIVAVGSVDGPTRRAIDADGLVVTPGFVDIHTHYDGQATWDPEVSPSSWHGVTTVVMGNCGVGFAPAHRDRHDWLIQLMEGVEDIPGTALAEGITWNWETFPQYLDELDRLPRVLDVSALVPHGAVRAYVMGERGGANAAATRDEIAAMAALVREALAAGAVGFSTTRTIIHRAKDGELAAGTTASPEELIGIGRSRAPAVAAGADGPAGPAGVFELASDMVDPEAELAWMTELSRSTGCRITFGTGQDHMRPDHWRTILEQVRRANAAGAHIVPQVGGRSTSVLFGLEATAHPFMLHSAYASLADLPLPERVERLRRPDVRAAILGETLDDAGAAAFIADAWGHMFPLGDPPDYEPAPDRSVAALARRNGRPPAEVGYDLLLERDGHALLYMPLGGYADGDFRALAELLTQPDVVLGLGDGGAHCGLLCDASVPTYMLSHWARDRSRGERLPLELAVNIQTRRTAALFGFEDRGLVAPGYLADLNVIDVDHVASDAPEMVYDLPAGGRRLVQRARGYAATIKRGVVVRDHDESTGERPGRLVRGPQPAPLG